VSAPAALVLARAPGDPLALAALGLGVEQAAALQALLIRRAVAWALAVAPAASHVAVPGDPAAVAALLPAGVAVLAGEEPAEAVERVGRGPLLIARAGCPRLGGEHAAAALDDLRAGCAVAFGATLDGGWYLAALREPRPELLAVVPERIDRIEGIAGVARRARALGVEVGMLRHERMLATPADAAALLADPLLAPDVRAAIAG